MIDGAMKEDQIRKARRVLQCTYEQLLPPPRATVIAIAPDVQNIQVRLKLETQLTNT